MNLLAETNNFGKFETILGILEERSIRINDDLHIMQDALVAIEHTEGSPEWYAVDYFRAMILAELDSGIENIERLYVDDPHSSRPFFHESFDPDILVDLRELFDEAHIDSFYKMALYSILLGGNDLTVGTEEVADVETGTPKLVAISNHPGLKFLMEVDETIIDKNIQKYIFYNGKIVVLECNVSKTAKITPDNHQMNLARRDWIIRPLRPDEINFSASLFPITDKDILGKVNGNVFIPFTHFNWHRVFGVAFSSDIPEIIDPTTDYQVLISWEFSYDDERFPYAGNIHLVSNTTGHVIKQYTYQYHQNREKKRRSKKAEPLVQYKLTNVTEFAYSLEPESGENITTVTAKTFSFARGGKPNLLKLTELDAVYESELQWMSVKNGPRKIIKFVEQRDFERTDFGFMESFMTCRDGNHTRFFLSKSKKNILVIPSIHGYKLN